MLRKINCFNDFENCLLTKKPKYVSQNLFKTKKHDILNVEQNKKALSVYDDKRFILKNGIDTLPWGYYKINMDRNNFVKHQYSDVILIKLKWTRNGITYY